MISFKCCRRSVRFFQKVGWGNLEVVKQTKNEIIYQLSSELIEKRLKEKGKCTFQLEAGYLAQQYEQTKRLLLKPLKIQKEKKKSNHNGSLG
ncbi:DUF2507 domain-containing protein [Niallia circulans]